MAEISNHIVADSRSAFGKGAARKLRAVGKIPAVIYGHGTAPSHIALPGHEVALLLRKANQVLELEVEGKPVLALVKDVQRDPVRQIIEHIDLIVVRKGEKVQVDVAVRIEGESAAGTVVLQDLNSIAVEVEATHIPESFVVSVEGLEAGAHITAGEVALPSGSVLITDPEAIVVGVTGPAAEAEEESGEAAAEEGAAEAPAE